MNKAGLISNVAEKSGITKIKMSEILKNLEDTIIETVVSGEKVKTGIGTFDSVDRKERDGRNPQTGEALLILASTVPRFKANDAFKDAVNCAED